MMEGDETIERNHSSDQVTEAVQCLACPFHRAWDICASIVDENRQTVFDWKYCPIFFLRAWVDTRTANHELWFRPIDERPNEAKDPNPPYLTEEEKNWRRKKGRNGQKDKWNGEEREMERQTAKAENNANLVEDADRTHQRRQMQRHEPSTW